MSGRQPGASRLGRDGRQGSGPWGGSGPQLPGRVGAGAEGCTERGIRVQPGLPGEAILPRATAGAGQGLLLAPRGPCQAPDVPSRRPGCTFTFKNKCDIEKHKSYHIKDDAYAKDGFKKFYKYEECKYEGCVYSKATNHFHCIRAGCGFTFTSTSQMTSHKRKHERRHIRASGSGVLGLPPSLLGAKDTEHEESSNDDLVDFSALSSKNSSLSASPTSQQSSASLAAATATSEAVPGATKPPNSKISGLLAQGLPGSIPLALALSNSGLPTSASYFPILPGRGSASLPVGAPGLMGTMSSGTVASVTPDTPALAASGAGESAPAAAAAVAATSVPVPPASIMERISASKGLISPMMARLAAAALKPSATFDPGEQAGPLPGKQALSNPRSSLASCRAEQQVFGSVFTPSPLLAWSPPLLYFLLGLPLCGPPTPGSSCSLFFHL